MSSDARSYVHGNPSAMTLRAGLAIMLAIVPLCGCSSLRGDSQPGYSTVVADPERDEAKAAALTEQAAKLYRQGKIARAEQTLQDALIADVSYGPAHNNLGTIYYQQGKFYLAAWEFEYARKVMPDRPEYHNNLGMVYEAVERLDKAVECYVAAWRIAPRNAEIIGNLARTRLKSDPNAPEVRELLSELLLYDTRPEWTNWAREQLALARLPEAWPQQVHPSGHTTLEPAPRPQRMIAPPLVN